MIAIGAASASLAPSASAQSAQGPRPENREKWIGAADYPRDAYLQNLQGTVAFSVAVDREGRVRRCTIRQSSGVSTLDAATCRLIAERARFTPAVDRKGAKASGTYASKVRWAIRWVDP